MMRHNEQWYLDLLRDLSASLACLTRVPVPEDARGGGRELALSAWAFPLIGVVVGGAGAFGYAAAMGIGATPLIGAVVALAVMIALTGAFHEDGLADTADGFGGGRDAEHKLEIMSDSRMGAYGATALGVALLARVAAIDALVAPELVLTALVAAGAMSRAAIVVAMHVLPPARADGLGFAAGRPSAGVAGAAGLIAVVVAVLVLPGGFWVSLLAACMCAAAIMWLARQQIDGHTGDVLGATQQAVEITVLIVLAAANAQG